MSHNPAHARRPLIINRPAQTFGPVRLQHLDRVIHVWAPPEILQADPLFSHFYTGRRRHKGGAASKEAICKDGIVHLSIHALTAARADAPPQAFLAQLLANH